MNMTQQEGPSVESGKLRWAVLIINRVLDRPNQVRYQRIVALATEFNLIVITQSPIPKDLEASVHKVCIASGGRAQLKRALVECRSLSEAGQSFYIHTQYAPVPLLAGYLCKRRYRCRWVYDLWDHPSLGWLGAGPLVRWARQSLWRLLLRRLVVSADAWIIAMHPGILGYMPPAPVSCRLVFARPGYDGAERDGHDVATQPKAGEVYRIAYVGSVSAHRGLDLMIAWAKSYTGPPVELCIAGPCSDNDAEALVAGLTANGGPGEHVRVHILGEIGAHDVNRLLEATDIALAPVDVRVVNYRYAYPVKVVQYMSHGLTVVATESHGTRAVIENGHNGFLCTYEQYDFARAMERALEICAAPERAAVMRKAALGTAAENRWSAVNGRLVEEIVALIDR